MSWKTAWRSFYYQDAPEPEDIVLAPAETALLVIDIQNTYLEPKPDPTDDARWQPFFARMRQTVIPNTARLIEACRVRGVEPVFARVACHSSTAATAPSPRRSRASTTFCCRRIAKIPRSCRSSRPKATRSSSRKPPTAR